jgi:hypothetical protein
MLTKLPQHNQPCCAMMACGPCSKLSGAGSSQRTHTFCLNIPVAVTQP